MMLRHDPGNKPLKETRVILLRHAETSAPDRFHGAESDVSLGMCGRSQAEAVAKILVHRHPVAIYCSAMARARMTAEAIARACGLTVGIEPNLHERKMGPLSGLTRREGRDVYDEAKMRWESGETDYTHEGGESYSQILARVLPVWERITLDSIGETIIVVAHGVVIRVLLSTILDGYGPANFSEFSIDNAAINELVWDGKHWRALLLNQILAEDPRVDLSE
ncbi:MAG: histidine phosphatase family protein [Isosphaeraceae bacterium]